MIWKLNILNIQFWIWFSWKLTKNVKTLNLGSDLSIDNIVRLGSADTKISCQDAVMKVLELTEKWKYPNLTGKFYVFSKIYGKHDAPLPLLDIHYSSAFYSTLYHFLFSRYLNLTQHHFSSDILVPFPDLSNLYSRGKCSHPKHPVRTSEIQRCNFYWPQVDKMGTMTMNGLKKNYI